MLVTIPMGFIRSDLDPLQKITPNEDLSKSK
jgi:hypothetical protein